MPQRNNQRFARGRERHGHNPGSRSLFKARENATKVKLYGGFIPRTYARQIMRESKSKAINLQTYVDKQNRIVMFNWLIGKIRAVIYIESTGVVLG